jgi:hypothetical protein
MYTILLFHCGLRVTVRRDVLDNFTFSLRMRLTFPGKEAHFPTRHFSKQTAKPARLANGEARTVQHLGTAANRSRQTGQDRGSQIQAAHAAVRGFGTGTRTKTGR